MKTPKILSALAMGVLAVAVYLSISNRVADSLVKPTRRVGLTVPSELAQVAAEQAGAILTIPVAEGDFVRVGDTICQQSSRLQELEVQRLRALAESDLRLRSAEAELENLEIETARARELAEIDITSDADLRAQELAQEIASIRRDQARLDQQQAVNEWRQAEERLEQRTVRSPLAGVVARLFKHQGETTEELSPIAEVVQLDPLWVEFEVALVEGDLFAKGADVIVAPTMAPDDRRTARVVFVSLQANPSSHTFLVRAAMPNPDHDWKSGLKVLVQTPVEAGRADDLLPKPPK